MTVHQCPKCDLRFSWKTEVDDHCWHDHPEFRHEYPAVVSPLPAADGAPGDNLAGLPAAAPERRHLRDGFVQWLVPRHPSEQLRVHHSAAEPPSEPQGEPRED